MFNVVYIIIQCCPLSYPTIHAEEAGIHAVMSWVRNNNPWTRDFSNDNAPLLLYVGTTMNVIQVNIQTLPARIDSTVDDIYVPYFHTKYEMP